ncbi:hypothetical protein DTO027I6_1989 [Penicillium roqueforti]|nr:hypothetical protein DTO027I6_1989 [Penicillium roqueforti]
MAEGARDADSDRDTAQLVKEHSGAFQNRVNTTQTDSPPIPETAKPDIGTDQLKADAGLETPEPAPETEPSVTEPAGSALGNIPIAHESQVPVGPTNETVPGEKRGIDSALAEDEQRKPEPSDGPDTKKLKTDEDHVTGSNGTAAAASNPDNKEQKKAGRSKKEKIKDAVNKIVPGDGVGSRTSSRTKGA